MSFALPAAFAFLALVLVLGTAFFHRADRKRRVDLERFAKRAGSDPDAASLAPARRRGRRIVLALATLCAFIALAGPEIGVDWRETRRRGIDVLFALDVSQSMLAADVTPSRLGRARLAILDLVNELGSDRVGLIAFAGGAFLQAPLTLDHVAFAETLKEATPDAIPLPGSNLASALQAAERALASKERNAKVLVLLSDGEDLGGSAVEAAQRAAEAGIRVFAVGVGSSSGELIEVPTGDGSRTYLKDSTGRFVRSRLDETTLRAIAETTGGFYVPLGRRSEGMERIREEVLIRIPKQELASRMRQKPIDRYQWPLAFALLLLGVEVLLSDRRRSAGAALGLALALALPPEAHTAEDPQELYRDQKWSEAAAAWQARLAPGESDPDIDFGLGAAAYRLEDFDEAVLAFSKALRAEDSAFRAKSLYNLGNAFFRRGAVQMEESPTSTLDEWRRSIEAYESALGIEPRDSQIRQNLGLVREARDELERRLAEQPPPQPSPEPNPQPHQQDREQDPEQAADEEEDEANPSSESEETRRDKDSGTNDDEEKNSEKNTGPTQDGKPTSPKPEPPPSPETAPSSGNPDPQPADTETGRLAPREAEELLDSLRSEERRLAIPLTEDSDQAREDDEPLRNW